VRFHDATASSFVPKVHGEVFTQFYAVGMSSPLYFKENDEHALALLSPVSPFLFLVNLDFPCTAHAFFPECLSNHCQGLCHTFTEICTKFDAVPLSHPSQNRIRPDTRLQIKGCKKNHHAHPSVWNVVCWLPRYAGTIICWWIALLQLLYRWQCARVCACVCVCQCVRQHSNSVMSKSILL
jgi:hypothetical protein